VPTYQPKVVEHALGGRAVGVLEEVR